MKNDLSDKGWISRLKHSSCIVDSKCIASGTLI